MSTRRRRRDERSGGAPPGRPDEEAERDRRREGRSAVAARATATPTDTPQQREPRTFRSRDGRVTYNERGQRLDSHGNVARRTNRSRRRDARNRARERESLPTSGEEGGNGPAVVPGAPNAALPASPLQLPWLAFQNGQTPQFGVNPGQPPPATQFGVNPGQPPPAPQFGVNPVDPNGFPVNQPPTGIPTGGTGGNPFATLGIPGPGQGVNPWAGLDDNQLNRALAYWNAVLPYAQFNQNAFQNQRDFSETVRRFGLEFPQRQREAAFNAAGRAQLPNQRFI